MVAILRKKTECRCLKCGHGWLSFVKQPKQCPVCKRKDWDGLHNSMGRLLVAPAPCRCPHAGCGYEWTPRKAAPKQCPMCKRYLVLAAVPGVVDAAPDAAPVRRVSKTKATRECSWCTNVYVEHLNDESSGMCPNCGTDFYTGEDVTGGKRWPKEASIALTVRMREGLIRVAHTALKTDQFDPEGVL